MEGQGGGAVQAMLRGVLGQGMQGQILFFRSWTSFLVLRPRKPPCEGGGTCGVGVGVGVGDRGTYDE